MKKTRLLPVLAIATVASTALALPSMAAAEGYHQEGSQSSHHNLPHNQASQMGHHIQLHVNERSRWEPPRHHHNHYPLLGARVVYVPVVRQVYRYQEYQPVARQRSLPGDGLRVSIVYGLNL